MSYIRYGHPLRYVKGESEDYIFSTIEGNKNVIEDYGDISNSGLVEILCRTIDEYYDGTPYRELLMGDYLKKKLAKKLNVELRKAPLTDKQLLVYEKRNLKQTKKEFFKLFKERKG